MKGFVVGLIVVLLVGLVVGMGFIIKADNDVQVQPETAPAQSLNINIIMPTPEPQGFYVLPESADATPFGINTEGTPEAAPKVLGRKCTPSCD